MYNFGSKIRFNSSLFLNLSIEGGNRMRWLNAIMDSMNMSLNRLGEIVKDKEAWRAAVHVVAKRRDLAMEQHIF